MKALKEPTTFAWKLEAGVGTITLTRPDRLNSLTFAVYEELADFLAALDAEAAVRAVVLTGEGRAFCSGGDVEDIIGELFARDMRGLVEFTRVTGRLIANIRKLRRPVIAAVNGVAVGAGAVMALACDFRIASDKAKFGFIFPKVGLCGADMGAAYLLPRVIGLAKASELLFLGDIINAEEARAIGLVTKVVPVEQCLATAHDLAARLASGPAFAHAMTKQMLESEHTMSLDAAIEAEAQAQAICMQHPDFRTAFDAWTAKQPIVFAGAPGPFRDKP
ncbi:MAG: Enoyl-CoA hydratase [Myxococcaceae bacterium]|nr:Enoyl-CoA hydratase [Myxococcaceae bacterium]